MANKLDCEIGFKVDWLRCTLPVETDKMLIAESHSAFALSDRKLGNMPAYNRCVAMKCGRLDWHSERPEQRLMLTLTGEDCTRLRAMGGDFRKLIKFLNEMPGVHFTRIDLAVDLLGGNRKSPQDLYTAVMTKKAQCRAQKHHQILSHSSSGELIGDTAYIGSRTSETMIRVYDKALETKQTDVQWVRVELELKNRQADAATWAIDRAGVESVTREMLSAFLSGTGVGWYEALLSDVNADKIVEEPGRKVTNWEQWLFDIVLPAVEKALREDVVGVREILEKALSKPVE